MKNSPGGKQPGDIESPQQKKTNSPPAHETAINLHSQREKQKLILHGEAISRTDWRRTWRVGETTRRRGCPSGGWSGGQFRKIQGNHTSASRSVSYSHLRNDVRRGRFTQCARATCPERVLARGCPPTRVLGPCGGMWDGDQVGASAPSEQTSCICGPDHVNEVQN